MWRYVAKRDLDDLKTARLGGLPLIGRPSERHRILDALRDRDGVPLAAYLEAGGDLDDELRDELVHHLRGGKKRRRGRPRTLNQESREVAIRDRFRFLQWHVASLRGARRSFETAIALYLELDKTIGEKTLRNYVGKGWTAEELEQIEAEHNAMFRGK